METTVRPYMEENAPVQVEFAIKRGVGERRRSSNKSGLQQHLLLPELSPQRRLSRNATPPVYPLSELKPDGSLLLTTDQDSEQLGLSHDAGSEHFSEDPASLQSPLKTLVLAPGVKLQNGDEMKVGPELPLFPTHMRKATFYQDDAIALTLAASMQSLHLCASVSSRNLHPLTPTASHSQHHPGHVFFSERREASLNGCACSL
ncbi:Protein abnormal spindle [Globisporangium polare]